MHGLVYTGSGATPKPTTATTQPVDLACCWLLDRLGASQPSAHAGSAAWALLAQRADSRGLLEMVGRS